MESAPKPGIVGSLAAIVPDARQILTGQYETPVLKRWYMKAVPCYRELYGYDSPAFKEFYALRQDFLRDTATPATIKAKVSEFLSLAESLIEGAANSASVATSRRSAPPTNRCVFIIHGHDELNRLRLQNMLKERLDLEPIVISSKPGQSQSIIDKFEEHAKRCTFAIALFTPDDLVTQDSEKYYQARPNIIFETGWFVGRLGKERVLILLKQGTKIHSDFDGVSRVHFRDDVHDILSSSKTSYAQRGSSRSSFL